MIISLVDEAMAAGARQTKACEVIGLTTRTEVVKIVVANSRIFLLAC